MAVTVTHRRATTSLDLIRRGSNEEPVLVVVKRHRDRAQFEHEVRWLTAAGHLPVARIEPADAQQLAIATLFNPSLTLSDTAVAPAAALAILTELARVVAELSVEGLSHGNLHADHVLRDRRGRVFVVSPAPSDSPEADLVGLARCCHQVLAVADAVAVERGHHPWADRDREHWRELAAMLAAGGLGPHRAVRHMKALGRELGAPEYGRLRRLRRF